MSDETDRCCGLAIGHEDRCAFFCSSCIGDGRDDMGLDSCPDCGGVGWFDDDDHPTYLTVAEYAAIQAQCDRASR